MTDSFVLRATERGYNRILSTGAASSYVAGHPDAVVTRHSSFNFNVYQSGRAGFGRVRVFSDEIFSGAGCGYNMHRHHNFIICAFVLQGRLTHINTVGNIDQLMPGDYYVFSAGSGGKHCELNLESEDMNAIYVWFLPDALLRNPTYARSHFDRQVGRNRIVTLVGKAKGALPIAQDVRVSRLVSDAANAYEYKPASTEHGVYAFVLEGALECAGSKLGHRDSVGIWGAATIALRTGDEPSDVLLVESVK